MSRAQRCGQITRPNDECGLRRCRSQTSALLTAWRHFAVTEAAGAGKRRLRIPTWTALQKKAGFLMKMRKTQSHKWDHLKLGPSHVVNRGHDLRFFPAHFAVIPGLGGKLAMGGASVRPCQSSQLYVKCHLPSFCKKRQEDENALSLSRSRSDYCKNDPTPRRR